MDVMKLEEFCRNNLGDITFEVSDNASTFLAQYLRRHFEELEGQLISLSHILLIKGSLICLTIW